MSLSRAGDQKSGLRPLVGSSATESSSRLTEVPVPWDPRKYVVVDLGGGLMTAILLVTGRRLAERYPAATVVTLVTWLVEPVLFAGDAESVFLAPAEPGAST